MWPCSAGAFKGKDGKVGRKPSTLMLIVHNRAKGGLRSLHVSGSQKSAPLIFSIVGLGQLFPGPESHLIKADGFSLLEAKMLSCQFPHWKLRNFRGFLRSTTLTHSSFSTFDFHSAASLGPSGWNPGSASQPNKSQVEAVIFVTYVVGSTLVTNNSGRQPVSQVSKCKTCSLRCSNDTSKNLYLGDEWMSMRSCVCLFVEGWLYQQNNNNNKKTASISINKELFK